MEQRTPYSSGAEYAVLGALLKDERAREAAFAELREDDFFVPGHRLIFRVSLSLNTAGKPLEVVTLLEYLESRGLTDEAGGFEYIADLAASIPMLSNLPHYISIIKEKSTLRKLIATAQDIMGMAYDGEQELSVVLAESEKRVFELSQMDEQQGLLPLRNNLAAAYEALGEIDGSGGITGLSTGFVELDHALSGLKKSNLVIVAARPGMGKTAFALNIAQYAGLYRDAVVAVFSLEMSRTEVIYRMLGSQAKVSVERMTGGSLVSAEWTRLAEVLRDFMQANIYVDDTSGLTISEISSKLRRLKKELRRLDLVVVDYLQLMTYYGKAQNRQQEVSEMSRAFKILARELDVPIVVLSQLSRGPESRKGHRPMMSDLRESGAIEQDADVILMLYRASEYQPEEGEEPPDPHVAEVIIAKNRNGATRTLKMKWNAEFMRFETPTDRME